MSQDNEIRGWNVVRNLRRAPSLRRISDDPDAVAGSLVYCFDNLDIQIQEFSKALVRLREEDLSPEEVDELLFDIGPILGQIQWFISLPSYYHYLTDQKPE